MAERTISPFWIAQAELAARKPKQVQDDLPSPEELSTWVALPLAEQQALEQYHYGQVLTGEPDIATRATRVAAKVTGKPRGPKRKKQTGDDMSTSLPPTIPGNVTDSELAELLAQAEQAALALEAERTADDRPKLDYNTLSSEQLEQLAACCTQAEVNALLACWGVR
jgi:hypothetical protein